MIAKEAVLELLRGVLHPVYERDIVSLGIVDEVKSEEMSVKIKLIFSSYDPLVSTLKREIESKLREVLPSDEVKIVILEVIQDKENHKKSALPQEKRELSSIRNVVAIASGKGGVGKSTVAVNLAIALSQEGYRVGLIDADIYGPSVPKMTDTESAQPLIDDSSGKELIVPIEKYGVKWISIGYFSKADTPLIWRGPMAVNALKQLFFQVKWDELDILLIDLPPGTGDIHISVIQEIPLSGAIVVSTPQDVALTDVEKGVNMFRSKGIAKPILGIVENMSWFTPDELPQNRYYIFGKEGCVKLAERLNLDILGQIPLVQSIREGGDIGYPVALNRERADGMAFAELAKSVMKRLVC